jgi:hypothetical protein
MALVGSNDSLAELLWEHGGGVGHMPILDIWIGDTNILWMPWIFQGCENHECSFLELQTQLSNQPLLAWPSPPPKHQLPIYSNLPAIYMKFFPLFEDRVITTYTRNFCT